MIRFNQQQDSSRSASTKSFILNPNLFYHQLNEKSTFSLHQPELSPEKPLKKGIRTLVSHSLQNTEEQSFEKAIYGNKKSEYEYTKSLEIQIASRERERLEIYKNLQDTKRQQAKLTYELNEERKKSAAFRMKAQQLEIFLKQNSDQKIAISKQKDQLFGQYQLQIQRRKSVEENEQKLRFKLEAFQSESQNVKKNYEAAKDNFKRQLEALINEGSRMREIIIQLENEKSMDKSYLSVMQRQIQVLDKQKSQQAQQKLALSQQLQKQRISFQQEKNSLNQRIQLLESGLQQLNKNQIDSQRQTQITKYRYSTEKDLLLREINFLKQQISAKSSQFSETSAKLNQERQKLQKQLYQKNSFAERLSEEIEQLSEKIKGSQDEISALKSELLSKQQKLQLLTTKKANEITSIQEEHQAQVNLLNQQFCQKSQLLQNEIFCLQQKLKQLEKIIYQKTFQYQELQKHFNQIIERQNQQHANQIHKYQQQLQSMGARLLNASNQDLLIRKIQLLEECLAKKQAELKVVEDNNTLLRKNFINSLTEQETLREQIKTTRSQYSESKSQSGQKSRRDISQQLRTKYLTKIESQHFIQSELQGNNNQMNLSRQRSNSNSRLKSVKSRDHQRSYKYVPLLSLRNGENIEAQFETQMPVSNIQKPPFDPMNLKRIRERNQFRLNTQVYKSTQEAKPENCNSDSHLTTSQVIPICLQQSTEAFTLKQDEQLIESEEQF